MGGKGRPGRRPACPHLSHVGSCYRVRRGSLGDKCAKRRCRPGRQVVLGHGTQGQGRPGSIPESQAGELCLGRASPQPESLDRWCPPHLENNPAECLATWSRCDLGICVLSPWANRAWGSYPFMSHSCVYSWGLYALLGEMNVIINVQ